MTLTFTSVIYNILRINNITFKKNKNQFLLVNDLSHVLVHLVVAEVPWAHCEIVLGLMSLHAKQVLLFLLYFQSLVLFERHTECDVW